uniref:Uncharacterized protein n=1 Tax=Ciona savignyi TaxID=51511 RepID=H2ZNF5_CIOSA
MTHYEVNSISNGLERCTMLLKDILDQDQQEPQRLAVTKKKRNLNTKTATRLAKPWQAGPWTKFDEDIPSSTPIITPIKRERLPTKQQQQNHANSLTSSQSSLIALLQNFNNSTLLQEQCNRVQ